MTAVPDAAAVAARLSVGKTLKTAEEVTDALAAEVSDQASRCRVEPYNAALAEALYRRVARNLAMRNLPLGVQSDGESSIRIGSTDPEVRRLEAPFRKLTVG